MTCAHCGRDNPAGARFCGGCGGSLAPRCPVCGTESAADASFCTACGSSLVARPAGPAGERKIVSIVFADLAGSTALQERLDPESTRAFMDRYYRAMQGAVEAEGGRVTQLLGDGVKAVFGDPRVAEDDALRAVRAAVGMQRAFRELVARPGGAVGELGLRVAVNTGEVVAKDETEIIGDPVNVAARLQQEAREGDVLIGGSTQRLVDQLVTLASFGTFTLKGRAEPVSAYRVVSLERPAGAPAIPFVGREEELRRLMAVYEAAVGSSGARLAVVVGSPGLGKSRLLAEIGRRLGERATLLLARCDATGAATFAPIAEALREHLGIDVGTGRESARQVIEAALPGEAGERGRIADGVAALLAGMPESPEETFFVVRRLLAALATARPVVLAIDDLQWAEPLLLDLTEHLVQWSPDVPLLLLAAARPELREARSSLTSSGGLVAEVVTLAGLDAVTASRLAAGVVGAEALPAAIAGRVLATSEGNPLFVGELIRMLVQDGVLRREGDRWTAGEEIAALEMPPTIHALLAARIERLRPEERSVLERAAVIGRQFSRTAVAQLLPPEVTDLDARLEALRRSELVEPDTGWLLGEPVLRFHHVLIRDAAYRRLLKHTRAELHERFADWLENRVGEAVDHDEAIGWQLEQAHRHLCELGPPDEKGRVLGVRASRRLAAAGRRALARDDVPLAAGLLGRALDRLDPADPARGELALDWCEALLAAGEVATASAAIDQLGRFAVGSDRLQAWHTCYAGELAALTDPKALRATADAVAAAAETLATQGDAAGEAKAHSVHALALSRLGQVGAAEAALDRALAAARRADDRRRSNAVLAGAPFAALWGPGPVARASGRCLDVVRVLRITQGAPAVEAVALRCQAVLEALRGRSDAAGRMIASSRRMVEELGITQGLLETEYFAGLIALIEGDAAGAEQSLREAYEGLRSQGLGIDAARAAAHLGDALLAQGRAAEAETLSRESETLAGDDLDAAITWRRVRAEALARRGEHASAVELARAAVEIAATTDALLHHADARLALAAALDAAGRNGEAAAEKARAIDLWRAKGATLLVEQVRAGAGPAPQLEPVPARRRVRPNAGTAHVARLDTAMAAREVDALATLFAEDMEVVDHPTGSVVGRLGTLTSLRGLLRVSDLEYRHEPVATLGDSLVLCRQSVSAGGLAGGEFDVGAYEIAKLDVVEVDAQGRGRRVESFAADRLGDGVVRLYERYAELLPEGPERERAAATARLVARVPQAFPSSLDSLAAVLAPDVEFVDHRPLGLPPRRGAVEFLEHQGTLLELASDLAVRIDDVLALRPNALLGRWTNSGRLRASGGAFEREFLFLDVFSADGLLARRELFATDRDAEALARFDDLCTRATVARPAPPRVRANAALANVRLFESALAAGDADAFQELLAEDAVMVEHPVGAEFDRSQLLRVWHSFLAAEDLNVVYEPLATLGDSLALCRQSLSAGGVARGSFDVGAYEREELVLVEVDATSRRRHTETFAIRSLGDAIARLYVRYAALLPEGPEKVGAVANARLVAIWDGPLDPDRHAGALAPSVEVVDHRTLGTWSIRGADALVAQLRSWSEVAEDVTRRADAVLAARADALLARWTHSGIDRTSGGAYERPFLLLWTLGTDGLATHWELFDPDREAEALARFDDLVAGSAAPRAARRPVQQNAATANAARLDRVIADRDADALPALYADDLEWVDHATGSKGDCAGALLSLRSLLRARDPSSQHEPLATLGASLALCRWSTSGSGFAGRSFDVGAYEREEIALVEVDAHGTRRRLEVFATHQLGDAVARLYERYAELLPEGPERDRAAVTAGSVAASLGPFDPERYATAYAPGIVKVDHRPFATHSAQGAAAVTGHLRVWLELAAELVVREEEVLALEPNALLVRRTFLGTERSGGGSFERPFLMLLLLDSRGMVSRAEQFDPDRDAEALARFDELVAERSSAGIENAATRAARRVSEAVQARDLARVAAHLAAGFRGIDRRPLVRLELARDAWLASYRQIVEMTSGLTWEVLATRGERLEMMRVQWKGADRSIGPSEIDSLLVLEVDGHEDVLAQVEFDPEDLDAAYAELDARYAAGEGADYASVASAIDRFVRAIESRDWEALAGLLSPVLVVESHGPLGWETLHGPAAYVESLQAVVDLAPDVRLRGDHMSFSERAALRVDTWVGTRDGGAFEAPRAVVFGFDGSGRIRSVDLYKPEQLEMARARFAAIGASSEALPSDPLAALARPNAASAAMDRLQAAFEARDWTGLRGLFAPEARFEDRRRHAQFSGDVDFWISNLRQIAELDVEDLHSERRLVATAGDRVCLQRVLWSGGPAEGRIEAETLFLGEVDENGRLVSGAAFDPEDLRAASRDAWDRWLACDALAASVLGPLPEACEGFNDRDRARMRAVLADDAVFDDHRLVGTGRIAGADAGLAAIAALWDLAPDIQLHLPFVLALERHGSVGVGWSLGSLSGGGAFESYELGVCSVARGRITRLETFEIDAVDAALARLAELRPDPLRIPPNAATQAAERWAEAIATADQESFDSLLAPDLVFEDRRRQFLTSGDRELLLASVRLVGSARPRISRTLLATAGGRLVLQRIFVEGTYEDAAFEAEFLELLEVDDGGRLVAVIDFDPGDRRAAARELLERHARSDGDLPAAALELRRALLDRDLERCRAAISPDFVFHDQRRTGLGRVEGAETWIAWLAALSEQSPDAFSETLYDLASEAHGTLSVGRTSGTLAEGGGFESAFVSLVLYRDGRLAALELFEPDDLDLARARFDGLRPAAPPIS